MVQILQILTPLLLITPALATIKLTSSANTLTRNGHTPKLKLARSTPLLPNENQKRQEVCSGSCVTCFGSGYISCPGDDVQCYKPGDTTYGLDSCSSSGSGSGTGSGSASTATSPSSPSGTGCAGSSDVCYDCGGCVACFGVGYISCPADADVSCYNPTDPQYDSCCYDGGTTCSSGSTGTGTSPPPSGSTGSGTSSDANCAAQHGVGNIACAPDGCYNPGDGESCCADGYYCRAGKTCSTVVGECCASGSTAVGCGGSGSGGGLVGSGGATLSSTKSTSSKASTANGTSSPTQFGNSAPSSTASGASSGSASGAAPVAEVWGSGLMKVFAGVMAMFGGALVAL